MKFPRLPLALLLFLAGVSLSSGTELTLANADFQGGQVAGTNNPVDWTTTENHPGAVYAEDWGAGASYLATLNLQARGDGNIIEQSFLTSEVTADSYGTLTVSMDLGTRANTGLARSIDVEIWNVTDGVSLALETYNFPTTGTGFIERRDFVLSYDNSDPSLAGDTIALRITSNGAGDTFATTHWLDNITVDDGQSAPDPDLVVVTPQTFTTDGNGGMVQVAFSNAPTATLSLSVTGATKSGPDAADFTLPAFPLSDVAPGDAGTIDLDFAPTRSGFHNLTLEISSNDSANPTETVDVEVEVVDPVASVSASTIDFGVIVGAPGSPPVQSVTVTNTGVLAAFDISDAYLDGGDAALFSLGGTYPVTVNPSATSDPIEVSFNGTEPGCFSTNLVILPDDYALQTFTIPVTATILPGTFSPLNTDFESGADNATADCWEKSPWAGAPAYFQAAEVYPVSRGRIASLQADDGVNGTHWIQQLVATETSYEVSFDFGYRNDAITNGDITLRVSIWDVTNDIEVAGQDFFKTDPGVAQLGMDDPAFGAFTTESVVLTPTGLTGGEQLALRFTNVTSATPRFSATALVDDVAAGIVTASSIEVTSISYNASTDEVTVAWSSQGVTSCRIGTSTDLLTAPATWPSVAGQTGLPGSGSVSFPADGTRRFYVVAEE